MSASASNNWARGIAVVVGTLAWAGLGSGTALAQVSYEEFTEAKAASATTSLDITTPAGVDERL